MPNWFDMADMYVVSAWMMVVYAIGVLVGWWVRGRQKEEW